MGFCKYSCEEIKKLKKALEVLKRENELLKKDNLLKDLNVFNRHYLDELLSQEYIPKLNHKKDWFFNVILVDLDDLHNINREKGYEAGDRFIYETIKAIIDEMKNNKTSGRIFRIGGDEFLIIYQPYDYLDLDNIPGITWAGGTFSTYDEFKKVLSELDKVIIEKKKNKSSIR